MSIAQSLLSCCLWASFAVVFYAYAGYPVVIWCLARCFGRRQAPADLADQDLPTLSLLIAAHNEEAVIDGRVRNALALDYPAAKRQIVIACDGCSDGTARIAERYAAQGVTVLDYAERRGKSATLNAAFTELSGEVVLLSDANTDTDARAARKLTRWFKDPAVGVVCGRLILTDPASGRNVDGLYWKYETFLKCSEGRLGALLGANGGIYAIRRSELRPIAADTVVDDMFIPLEAKLRSGCAIHFDREAVAHEESAEDVRAEFHRRSRIGAGAFQCLARLRALLHPGNGWVAFTFLSHKVFRWLCPFFLLLMLASNLLIAATGLYLEILMAQILFYATALCGSRVTGKSRALKLVRLTTMFVGMNAALLNGFWRWVWGSQRAAWKRTARPLQVAPLGLEREPLLQAVAGEPATAAIAGGVHAG